MFNILIIIIIIVIIFIIYIHDTNNTNNTNDTFVTVNNKKITETPKKTTETPKTTLIPKDARFIGASSGAASVLTTGGLNIGLQQNQTNNIIKNEEFNCACKCNL